MEVIHVEHLTKRFGAVTAVEDISVRVEPGEIYGFLGLNGAGKTTLIRALLRMISPDSGSISLLGSQVDSRFGRWNEIGYLVETPYAYPNLSVVDNLRVYHALRGLQDASLIDKIIQRLKLTPYQHVKAKTLSLGNRQRLGLAKALMHSPRLVILDEPTNGLDPEGIVEVRELLISLAAHGSTIFLSSHILGEIARVATRIGIIHHGRMLKELQTQELDSQLDKKLLVTTRHNDRALRYLKEANYEVTVTATGELSLTGDRPLSQPDGVSALLSEKGLPPTKVYPFTEDLEMFFLRTIGRAHG